jgi:hypothetical protein
MVRASAETEADHVVTSRRAKLVAAPAAAMIRYCAAALGGLSPAIERDVGAGRWMVARLDAGGRR